MALVLKDRVQEFTSTAGTGTLTLTGAVPGFSSFAGIGNGNTTFYCITDNISLWEAGIGTYTASGTTLSRDTVLSNSSGNTSLVNFGAGVKNVFCGQPSQKAVYLDSAGNASALGTPASGNLGNCTGYTYANLAGTVPTWNQNTTGNAATATTANALNSSNSYSGVSFTASAGIYAAGTNGFYSSTYIVNSRNPIWRFANADGYGLSYFQGTAGYGSSDSIGFHFGTATAAGSQFTMTMGGAFIASGNITAYSDERLKKDWAPVSDNFVEQLAQVKSGTYTRIDSGERQAGTSAQDWQKLLPEVVMGEETLSVAYGNAALVSAVELAKEVVSMREMIEELRREIASLKG